jgi:hypothetical protein
MKKFILFIALFCAFSFAQEKKGALGLWLQGGNPGETWGMDYKHLGKSAIVDIYLKIPTRRGDNFSTGLYGGYYWIYPVIKADASMGRFPLYWGPAGGFGFWDTNFAIRAGVTGGISWILPGVPIDISLELNPIIEVHHLSWKDQNGKDQSDTDFRDPTPDLFFRMLFHFYLF